jgi:GDP-L-fucose synthase
MVGSAIVRKLKSERFTNIITRTHSELDLTNQAAVRDFFQSVKIDYVVLAAAKVGGIHANNTYPAEFIYQNPMMETNVIHEAWRADINSLLFLGSSCIYPKFARQPMAEHELLTGVLEPTNEPYAIAKIAGIKLCESYNRQYDTDFRSVMPTNLYGPNDNFYSENSHVIPALIRRFHDAKINADPQVTVWGSGKVYREFLHIDDMASACVHVMKLSKESYARYTEPMLSHINVGTGKDVTIQELAEIIKETTGFKGELKFDSSQPDGTPKKLLDASRLNQLGWQAQVELKDGLKTTYAWFLNNHGTMRVKF